MKFEKVPEYGTLGARNCHLASLYSYYFYKFIPLRGIYGQNSAQAGMRHVKLRADQFPA